MAKKKPQTITMRPTAHDYAIFANLEKKLGMQSKSAIIRLALSRLAEMEGVTAA